MITVNTIKETRAIIAKQRAEGKRIVFVPTMGNLHAGHISLVEKAHEHGGFVVVSIFVNPMQFGANEDLDTYPRTLEQDQEKLLAAKTDLIFAPNAREMYPKGLGSQTVVSAPNLAKKLCGISRPQFFNGVATVVSKLFNIVRPDAAIFGEKDFQQLMVIRQMVEDLDMGIDIVGVPTARENSGLAMSSRNGYLSEAQKVEAANLYRIMLETKTLLEAGCEDFDALREQAKLALANHGFDVDYFEIY